MPEDFTRVVGAVLADDGSIAKLILEQEDHSQSEVVLGSGTTLPEGLGDTLYIYAAGLNKSITTDGDPFLVSPEGDPYLHTGGVSMLWHDDAAHIEVLKTGWYDGYSHAAWANPSDSTPTNLVVNLEGQTNSGVLQPPNMAYANVTQNVGRFRTPAYFEEGEIVIPTIHRTGVDEALALTYCEFQMIRVA